VAEHTTWADVAMNLVALPVARETRRLAFDLHRIACNLNSSDPVRATLAAAATLLQQQQHLLGLAGKELDAFIEQQAAHAPVAVPVAVSKRLPGEWDCDAEGSCWLLHVDKLGLLEWHFLNRYPSLDSYSYYGYTHWLPHHAIPLPQAGEGEA